MIFLKLFIFAWTTLSAYSSEEHLFANDLYKAIGENENMVFSPYSIQACLGLAYMGADGQTASEMAKGLRFDSMTKEQIAESYSKVLKESKSSDMLKIVNKMYINKGIQISDSFTNLSKNFESAVEHLDFSKGTESENVVNSWIEAETNGKIKDLLSPGTINEETKAILVNAIYFKAQWLTRFYPRKVRKLDFYSTPSNPVKTDFMYSDRIFPYGSIDELNASAVELEYRNSSYSMIFLLPNEKDGLPKLIEKLDNNFDLLSVPKNLSAQPVYVYIPKFKVEYNVELKPVLSKLGMTSMFSRNADFTSMFKNSESIHISEVFHKAIVRVDEDGTEAAAGNYVQMMQVRMYVGYKTFKADHPFLWYIKDDNNIYFMGQVTKF